MRSTVWLFTGIALLIGAVTGRGEAVSKEPPADYPIRVVPWLTPIEQVLNNKNAFSDSEQPGVVLLAETVRSVDGTGKSWLAIHQVCEVRTEAGVKPAGSNVESYRKSDQRIHLVLAHSIHPDGTRQPVATDGVFLQSPQRDADASLYSDIGELVVVFPNVKPGTITESIILIEDLAPRIPNEYTGMVSFGNGWAVATQRHVLEMEESLAKRLHLTPLGVDTPVPTKGTARKGQACYTWERRQVPRAYWEPGAAPPAQIGPAVWLTTWEDWNAFASWYQGLLKGRDQLPAEICKEVDAWTHSATNSADVQSILLEKVACDVRYTGLEFGRAAFQPQAPAMVWSNRYGDCKDKANLLRTMLAHKGVRSFLAFLATDHAGRIDANSPSCQQFNHVILAVEQPAGGYVYCDPTIKFARPGLLRSDDADREVVLVRETSAEFVRTPAQSAGLLQYDFDLRLHANGNLEGWLTIESTGYHAARWAEYLVGQTRDRIREQMLGVVRDFYKGAQLIDVEQPVGPARDRQRIRVYWIQPSGGNEENRRDTLMFPHCEFLYPQFTTERPRRSVYWQAESETQVRCRIQLPAGWAPETLPRSLQIDTAPLVLSARWENVDNRLTGSFVYRSRQQRVTPEQFALLDNATQSLTAWLSKPVTVKHGATTAPTREVELNDLPMMPTAEGQLELIQQRFPIGNDLRKEALGRVLQWFPNDKPARFMAQMRLLELELRDDPKNGALLQRVKELLEAARREVDVNYHAWGENHYAAWLVAGDRRDEGLALYQRLARDPSLPAFRRGWAAVEAGAMLKDKQPKEALAVLRATIDLESDALQAQFDLFVRLLLSQDLATELSDRLQKLVAGESRMAPEVLANLLRTANALRSEGSREHAETLVDAIEKVIKAGNGLSQFEKDLFTARESLQSYGLYQKIVGDLRQYLATNAPPWWSETSVSDETKNRDALAQAIVRLEQQNDYRRALCHRLEMLLRFPPDCDGFPEQLWRLAAAACEGAGTSGLRSVLLSGCDQLPRTSVWHYEGRFTRAAMMVQAKEEGGAMKIYDALLADSQLPTTMRAAAYRLKGDILEKTGDYDGALGMYRHLEHDLALNPRSYNALLHAVFINLARSKQAEAERVIRLMARADGNTLREVPCRAQITDFVMLTKAGDATAYWQRQEKWWPLWEKIEAQLGLEPLGKELVIPVIPDLPELGRELGLALQKRDRAASAEKLRLVFHAARWLPRYAAETAGATHMLSGLFPRLMPDLHDLCVAMLADLAVSDPEIAGQCLVQHVTHLGASGKITTARECAAAGYRQFAEDPVVGPALAQIWAMAAIQSREQLEPAAAALEALLARGDHSVARPGIVDTLANLYRALHRPADELALLKRELTSPAFRSDVDRGRLQARYEAVRADSAGARLFHRAVSDWLKEHKPAWYDFAEPHDTQDARCRNLREDDDRLRRMNSEHIAAETVKAGLLAAQSPDEPYVRRVEAFRLAMKALAELQPDGIAALNLYKALYNNPQFDEQLRGHFFWLALVLDMRYGGDLKPYSAHELALRFNDKQKNFLKRAPEYGSALIDQNADLESLLVRQLEQPLDSISLGFLQDGFGRLMARGRLDAAQRVYAAVGNASMDVSVTASRSQIQLKLLRQLGIARRLYPRHKAIADFILTSLRPSYPAPPANWQYLTPKSLDRFDRRTATAIRIAMLENQTAPFYDVDFFSGMAQALPHTAGDDQIRFEVARQLIEQSSEDEVCASAISAAPVLIDLDDAANREKTAVLFKPYRDNDKYPLSLARIRLVDANIAWRANQSFDFDNAFDNLKAPGTASVRNRFLVSLYLQKKNVTALKSRIMAFSPEELVNPVSIGNNLSALEMCGLKDEAQLVRQAASNELYCVVLRSWCTLDRHQIDTALTIAENLNATNGLPAAWEQHILAQTGNEPSLWHYQSRLALFHQDWSGLLAATERILADWPNNYDAYWDKANALYHLNRCDEAIGPLKTFLSFCHNHPHYLTASDLLKKLQSK